jgi:hypothetical protein
VSVDQVRVRTEVEIFGVGFDPQAQGTVVTFGGTPAALESASPSRLLVRAPAGLSSGTLRVVRAHLASAPEPQLREQRVEARVAAKGL